MKGRFQPTTVGNMVKCDNGGYVCYYDYQQLEAENAALREKLAEEIRISNERGEMIEQLLADLSAASTDLAAAQKDAEICHQIKEFELAEAIEKENEQ